MATSCHQPSIFTFLSLSFPTLSMGCGASKCSYGDIPLPAGLRPLFCSGGCGSLSKKELLSKGDQDVHEYPVTGSADHGRRSMSSSTSSEDGPTRLMKTETETETETEPDEEEARRASENESGRTSLSPIQEEDSGGEEEMGERGGEEEEGDEEEEKNNGKSSFQEFGLECPRSPSFREYCTITDQGKNHDWQSDQKNADISNSTQAVKKVKEGRTFSKTIMNVMAAIKSPLSRSSQVNASASD